MLQMGEGQKIIGIPIARVDLQTLFQQHHGLVVFVFRKRPNRPPARQDAVARDHVFAQHMPPGVVGRNRGIGKFFNHLFVMRLGLTLKPPVPQRLAVQELVLQSFGIDPNRLFTGFHGPAPKFGRVQANVEPGQLCECWRVLAIFLQHLFEGIDTLFGIDLIHARQRGAIQGIHLAIRCPRRSREQASKHQNRKGLHGDLHGKGVILRIDKTAKLRVLGPWGGRLPSPLSRLPAVGVKGLKPVKRLCVFVQDFAQ